MLFDIVTDAAQWFAELCVAAANVESASSSAPTTMFPVVSDAGNEKKREKNNNNISVTAKLCFLIVLVFCPFLVSFFSSLQLALRQR